MSATNATATPDTTGGQTTLGQIIELTERKRSLESEARLLKDQLEPLHRQLLEEFADQGLTSARHAASGKLVYVSRKTWARAAGGDKTRAYDALISAGLEDYAERGFNTNKLSAYFRELIKQHEDNGEAITDPTVLLPAQLQGVIELTTDNTVAVRA